MSTTINWSTMTKQRRNAFIAEHVMGQRLHADFALDSETEIDVAIRVEGSDGVIRIEPLPDYVESMDAAWLIVEKMRNGWMADFIEELADSLLDFLCNGDAESICIAGLRAMGYTVQTEEVDISSYLLKSDPPEQEQP